MACLPRGTSLDSSRRGSHTVNHVTAYAVEWVGVPIGRRHDPKKAGAFHLHVEVWVMSTLPSSTKFESEKIKARYDDG